MNLRTVCSLAVILLAACGGSSGGGSPIAIGDLPHAAAVATCTRALACCAGVSGAPTEADCETQLTTQLQTYYSQIGADTNVTYNASVAGSCVAAIPSQTCENLVVPQPSNSCNFFVGNIPNGSATCYQAIDCASGLCANIPSGTSGPPGTCMAQVASGGNCSFGQG